MVLEHLAFSCDLAVFQFYLREGGASWYLYVWPSAKTSVKPRTTAANRVIVTKVKFVAGCVRNKKSPIYLASV